MSPVTVGIIAFSVLVALLAFGVPVGFAMAVVGFAGLWFLISGSAALITIGATPFVTVCSYHLAVLPLFLLMAQVCFVTHVGDDLYNLAAKWLGHQPGGLAMATVAGCAGFAAVSASSAGTTATMGLVAIPQMKRYNYDPALATGCVAAGGSLGVLIPPSAALIIFGIITETSIGKLFIGGIVPGILEALFYMVTIYILCIHNPAYGPRGPSYSFREKVAEFRNSGEIVALVALLMGGIIVGWFTPTEAGAVGVLGAIFFSLFRRRLNWQKLKQAVFETMKTTGMIYLIVIGAFIFMPFVAMTNIPSQLAEFIGGLAVPPLVIMGLIVLVNIFLGCLMDALALMLITVPIFFPLVLSLGFSPIWFGIFTVRMGELGVITPPIGLNVYVIAGVAPDVPMETIFKGTLPFVISDLVHVALLLFFPAIVLFLPSLM